MDLYVGNAGPYRGSGVVPESAAGDRLTTPVVASVPMALHLRLIAVWPRAPTPDHRARAYRRPLRTHHTASTAAMPRDPAEMSHIGV